MGSNIELDLVRVTYYGEKPKYYALNDKDFDVLVIGEGASSYSSDVSHHYKVEPLGTVLIPSYYFADGSEPYIAQPPMVIPNPT